MPLCILEGRKHMGTRIFLGEEFDSEPFLQINQIPMNVVKIKIMDNIKDSSWRKKRLFP
jgi:hypothetical protein